MKSIARILCAAVVFVFGGRVVAEEFVDDITPAEIKTFLRENIKDKRVGIVVGYVDERGSWTVSYGKLDNGTDQDVDADTVFEIGSVTKTFTALLFQDMVARGEMKLDDPVAKYLPDSVKMPARGGREITLMNLACQDSGLPFNADNYSGDGWRDRFANYTEEKLYEYLSNYKLTVEPGAQYLYSNVGMGLLGHVMARRAGTDIETLLVQRVCRPLHMDSTRITLSPELKARFARGHDQTGQPVDNYEFQVLAGTGALRSTVNDLLKYVSANIGLTKSELTPLMEPMHEIRHTNAPVPAMEGYFGNSAMPWVDCGVYQPPGTQLLGHAGGTGGYSAFVGFDKQQRRGVVVLFNQAQGFVPSMTIGWRVLQRAPLTGAGVLTLGAVRSVTGVGMSLDRDDAADAMRIGQVYDKAPAARAGLTAGIIVRKINDVSTAGKTLAECASLMRGAAGTKLRLEIEDADGKPSTVELTRESFRL